MNNYQKCEYIHSQLQELADGVSLDVSTMIAFIEDIREDYINKENKYVSTITNTQGICTSRQ